MVLTEKLKNEYERLETGRLILRPVTMDDAEDMFEYTKDPSVTAFIQVHNKTIEAVKKGIHEYYLSEPIGKYALELKGTHKLIGTIDFRLDQNVKTAELGYVLNRDYQRKGYMYEAVQKMFWLAFEELGLESVYAACVIQNIASEKLMKKSNMKREGVQRMRYKMKDNLWDTMTYSILQSEYFLF